MAISYQHKEIWDILINVISNPYGVAGLMGNLFAESSLDPKCITGGGLKTKKEKEDYIRDVNSGFISSYMFSNDDVAFGLAQWRYWSRKEALLSYAKESGAQIEDPKFQCSFLIKEIATYKTVWTTLLNAKSVKEASDIVMERYEKPGNMSEKAKAKRAAFGQECYDLFALENVPTDGKKYVITTMSTVNLRCGPGKVYSTIIQAKKQGEKYEWVATAENGWHAIIITANTKPRVAWISPDYSELKSG